VPGIAIALVKGKGRLMMVEKSHIDAFYCFGLLAFCFLFATK
jgi:hypothetical protein